MILKYNLHNKINFKILLINIAVIYKTDKELPKNKLR